MPPTAPEHRHLPRLAATAYQGHRFVHWTMAVKDRRTGWLTPDFHADFRDILLQAAAARAVVVSTYCLMPDHLHLLAAGVAPHADQQLWARAIRRRLNLLLAPLRLQKQAYDHVLRPAEARRDAFAALVHYLMENPVRAGLAANAAGWSFTGACVPNLPALDPRQDDFPDHWWRYWAEIAQREEPPLSSLSHRSVAALE